MFVENTFYKPRGTQSRSSGMCSNIHLSPASLCGYSGRDFGGFRFYYLPLKHGTCRKTEPNCSAYGNFGLSSSGRAFLMHIPCSGQQVQNANKLQKAGIPRFLLVYRDWEIDFCWSSFLSDYSC